MEEAFIGGWATGTTAGQTSSDPAQLDGNGNVGTQLGAPAPSSSRLSPSPRLLQTGYPFVHPRLPSSASSSPGHIHGVRPSFDQHPLATLTPVERSEALNLRKRIMNPYLQFMCGPLLRYDTIDEHGVWYGAAMIVSEYTCFFFVAFIALLDSRWVALTLHFLAADAGSTYEPYPTLMYRWDPKNTSSLHRRPSAHGVDLGPHPADPMTQHYGVHQEEHLEGPTVVEQRVLGTELYVYGGRNGYVSVLPSANP
jgi:hypothetical protein